MRGDDLRGGLQVNPLDCCHGKGRYDDHLLTKALRGPRGEDGPSNVLGEVSDPVVSRVGAVVIRTTPQTILLISLVDDFFEDGVSSQHMGDIHRNRCKNHPMSIKIHFDMETQDPDDVMTLAILATHPRVDLVSLTLTPGGSDQVGLVKHVLERVGHPRARIMQVGGDPQRGKASVSAFHEKWLGKWESKTPTYIAQDVLDSAARAGATLLTGAPLKNLERIPPFKRWVAQGGFAGDSVVPLEYRIPKFAGKETCATFNFGGAPKIAEAMLESPEIGKKLLVSKNVCHGVTWDRSFHQQVKALSKITPGMALVLHGMNLYLSKNPEGKKLHDPLAMVVAIEPDVCEFRDVEVYRQRGEWGSRLKEGSDVAITVALKDRKRFFEVLTDSDYSGPI